MIRFGDCTLDTSNERLTRSGEVVALQPQPMKVLRILLERRGELVSRKELQQAVWGTDTFVDFDQGLNWCIKRIREVLGDDANAPRFIETIPRKGYRFIATAPRFAGRLPIAAAAFVAAILLGLAGIRRVSPVTVVILPFDNYSADADAGDATTDELINRVGRLDPAHIRVIDRATAAKFKREGECLIHIGRELHAQFVIEGAVQKMHTTAALYRVADNTQVWAAAEEVGEAPARLAARIATTFDRPPI